jgi:hypothetical protein
MRNRKRNRRFASCETREAVAMMPPPSPFPDVELTKTDGPVGVASTGRGLRTTLTLLSYLFLPVILFLALPESQQPLCLIAAAFAGHKVLNS